MAGTEEGDLPRETLGRSLCSLSSCWLTRKQGPRTPWWVSTHPSSEAPREEGRPLANCKAPGRRVNVKTSRSEVHEPGCPGLHGVVREGRGDGPCWAVSRQPCPSLTGRGSRGPGAGTGQACPPWGVLGPGTLFFLPLGARLLPSRPPREEPCCPRGSTRLAAAESSAQAPGSQDPWQPCRSPAA